MSAKKKNDAEEIQTASQWLTGVANALDLDYQVMKPVVGELLDLTAGVAHGPSRPAAPLTTFLVGAATGKALNGGESNDEILALIKKNMAAVDELLEAYREQNDNKED